MQGDYSRPKWHWLEVAGKVPGPLHDDEPSGGLRLAVKCRRHHFCARDERGVWTHHTGSCPNFGGGLVGKQLPRSTMLKCRASRFRQPENWDSDTSKTEMVVPMNLTVI